MADTVYPSTGVIDEVLSRAHSATALLISLDWLKSLAANEVTAVSTRLADAGYMQSFCTPSAVAFEVLACMSAAPSGRFRTRNITHLIGAASWGASAALGVGKAAIGAFRRAGSTPSPHGEEDNVTTATAAESPMQPKPGQSHKSNTTYELEATGGG